MQGRGTYTWANGTRFEGEWRDGIQISGIKIGPDGTRVEIANGAVVESPQQAVARVKLEEERKAQEGRDRLAREARTRAAQARAAEREQARKNEQDAQDAQEKKPARQ